jgi:hypothetical protein
VIEVLMTLRRTAAVVAALTALAFPAAFARPASADTTAADLPTAGQALVVERAGCQSVTGDTDLAGLADRARSVLSYDNGMTITLPIP